MHIFRQYMVLLVLMGCGKVKKHLTKSSQTSLAPIPSETRAGVKKKDSEPGTIEQKPVKSVSQTLEENVEHIEAKRNPKDRYIKKKSKAASAEESDEEGSEDDEDSTESELEGGANAGLRRSSDIQSSFRDKRRSKRDESSVSRNRGVDAVGGAFRVMNIIDPFWMLRF